MRTVNDTHFRYEDEPQDVELFQGYPAPLLHFATVCCILFILLGIPGNLGTIIALYRCKKVRNATAVFIMNLSVSDLMFCCFNLPLAASTFYSRKWRHGKLLCQLFPLLRYGLLAVSLFTVLAITINRYVMIGHPTLYPTLYRKEYLGLMVACTWVCGFGALVATWLGLWGQFGLDRQIGSCSILPDEKGRSPKSFLFMVAFVIPCIAIVVCYARIFYIVRITALKSRSGAQSAKTLASRTTLSAADSEVTTKKVAGSKNTLSREDSAIGTSTTGASATISADRSSSAFCDGGHWKSGAHKSTAAFQKEVRQNILNANQVFKAEYSRKRASDFRDDSCGRDHLECLEQKLLPNLSFLHRRASSEPEVHLGEEEINRERASINRGPGESRDADGKEAKSASASAVQISTENFREKAYLETQTRDSGLSAAEDSEDSPRKQPKTGMNERKRRFINLGFILRRKEPGQGGSRGASATGKMSSKDKKLLKMILVIFLSFLVCYLPITISKTFRHVLEIHSLNIAGYVLIYLTTCMNPIIYVVMSSEYRQAYKNLLTCRGTEATQQNRNGSQK